MPVAHPDGPASAVRWRILAILVLASFVAYVLRTNMSVAGQGLMSDLGLSKVQLGTVLAAFAWGYAIFQFPGGVLGDLVGARRALALLAIGWAILNLLTGLVPGQAHLSTVSILVSLVVLRFLMGAAQAPLFPVIGGGTTCNWFPVAGWAFPTGLQNAGLTLGAAATGPLIAWLTQAAGWRQSFVLTAPLGLLVATVWWWYVRDFPAEHADVSQAELDLINANRPDPDSLTVEPGDWKVVLGNRDVLLLAASYFLSNYVFYFFFNWLFIYLIDNRGFAVLEGGFYAAAPWIAGAVGAVAGGHACDRLSRSLGLRRGCRWPSVLGLGLTGVFVAAAAIAADARVAVVLLSLCLAFQQFTEGPFWAATIAVAGRHSSAACGVLNTGGNVVGGIGALLVPLTVDSLGWGAALGTTSLFALAAALLWLWIRPDRPLVVPREARGA